jgi:hypothetical protein
MSAPYRSGPSRTEPDGGEAAIRTVIAAALAQHDDINGRGLDALFAMRHAEMVVRALEHAGYEIRRNSALIGITVQREERDRKFLTQRNSAASRIDLTVVAEIAHTHIHPPSDEH